MRLCLCDSCDWTDSVPASGFPLFRAAGLPRRSQLPSLPCGELGLRAFLALPGVEASC